MPVDRLLAGELKGMAEDLVLRPADPDVVALTCLSEGKPVTLVEAMPAARPVVATRVGGGGRAIDRVPPNP